MRHNLRHPYEFETSIDKISSKLNITEDFVDNAIFLTKYPSYFPIGTLRRPAATLSQAVEFAQGESIIIIYPGDYSGELEPVLIPAELKSLKIVGMGDRDDIHLPRIIVGGLGVDFSLNIENVTFNNQYDEFTIQANDGVLLNLNNIAVLSDYNKAVRLENKVTVIKSSFIEGAMLSLNSSDDSLIRISDTVLSSYEQGDIESQINNKENYITDCEATHLLKINSNIAVIKNLNTVSQIEITSEKTELFRCKINNSLLCTSNNFLIKDCEIQNNLNLQSAKSDISNLKIEGDVSAGFADELQVDNFKIYGDSIFSGSKARFKNSLLYGEVNISTSSATNLDGVYVGSVFFISSNELNVNNLQLKNNTNINSETSNLKNINIVGNLNIVSTSSKISDLHIFGNISINSTSIKLNDFFINGVLSLNSSSGKLNDLFITDSITLNNCNVSLNSVQYKRSLSTQTPFLNQINGKTYISDISVDQGDLNELLNNSIKAFVVDGPSAEIYFGTNNLSGGTSYIDKRNGAFSGSLYLGNII